MNDPRRPAFLHATRRSRVLTAAVLWTCVGIGLAAAGLAWTLRGAANVGAGLGFLAAAAVLGAAKGRWILAPRARANVARIAATEEREPVLRFQSAAAWGMVGVMVVLGWILRHSGLPRTTLGPLYAAVGSALLVGAFPSWGAWRRMGRPPGGAP